MQYVKGFRLLRTEISYDYGIRSVVLIDTRSVHFAYAHALVFKFAAGPTYHASTIIVMYRKMVRNHLSTLSTYAPCTLVIC